MRQYNNRLLYKKAYLLMCQAKIMAELYEQKKDVIKYINSSSRGHEAIQLAIGLQLLPHDFVSPYYRDEIMLMALGIPPYQLMLQLLAKRDDPFSGGINHYCHASLRRDDMPQIMMQSSSTGMQAIPSTGAALGIKYSRLQNTFNKGEKSPVVVCSLGDGAVTEGEVSEALQMAVLKQLPILYLVQDNNWSLSAKGCEIRAQNAAYYARGFNGLEVREIDGTDFKLCYDTVKEVFEIIRTQERPVLIYAKVPLIAHHTSGVRKEMYRDDWEDAILNDPILKIQQLLMDSHVDLAELIAIEKSAKKTIENAFNDALKAEEPDAKNLSANIFAATPITKEKGKRAMHGGAVTVMVDGALSAMQEIMDAHPEALFFGQDVGARLGGVFREAATLAQRFGEDRVFNMPIQEAFIIGCTVGLSAVGCKPIVEIPFADFIWPGLNQLFAEVSRSCYLSNGKWPVSCVIRVAVGAYGNGGPYHSSSIESVLSNIHGIKIVYPSNGADLKGLMKAAFYDPNPVIILEHKGLYWSKLKDTEGAKAVLPDNEYIVPIGVGRKVLSAETGHTRSTITVITYGAGVHWATRAAQDFAGRVEIIDLRSLWPLDEGLVFSSVKKHGRCLIVTEEPVNNSFALALAGKIQNKCFKYLDAPIEVIGSQNVPAIPINMALEEAVLPNAHKVAEGIKKILSY